MSYTLNLLYLSEAELLLHVGRTRLKDRLCGLVVRVPGYRSRSPGSVPSYQIF
jgi:hypothetical protein